MCCLSRRSCLVYVTFCQLFISVTNDVVDQQEDEQVKPDSIVEFHPWLVAVLGWCMSKFGDSKEYHKYNLYYINTIRSFIRLTY